MTTRGHLAVVSLVLALPLALSGCGSSDARRAADRVPSPSATSTSPVASPTTPDPDAVQYVALGDSYAAAPGVPTSDPADGCFRSDHNYAHLVAAADPKIALTDVTCSGATSDDVIAKQVSALSSDTDLVTIGIGGNDFGLFTRVLGSCLALANEDGAKPCTKTASAEVAKVSGDIATNIGKVLDSIAQAAPEAQILVVGYPALLPTDGSTCPELVPLATGDYPFVASINKDLSEALENQADQRGLTSIDVFTASAGHDVCATAPWVNGIQIAADGTFPLHPFAVEQRAVARMIDDTRHRSR